MLAVSAPSLSNSQGDTWEIYSYDQDIYGLTITQKAYKTLMLTKIRTYLRVARDSGCDVLIAGVLGCGLYQTLPQIVAQLFKQALEEIDVRTGHAKNR